MKSLADLGRVTGNLLMTVAATALTGLALILIARELGPRASGAMSVTVSVSAVVTLVVSGGTGVALRLRSAGRVDSRWNGSYLGYVLLTVPLVAITSAGVLTLALSAARLPGWLPVLGGVFAAVLYGAQQLADVLNSAGRTVSALGGLALSATCQAASVSVLAVSDLISLSSALSASLVGGIVQCLYYVRTIHAFGGLARPRFSPSDFRLLLRTGSPALGFAVGTLVAQRLDRILLAPIAGLDVAGIYGVAATVAELVRLATMAAGSVIFVSIAEHGLSASILRVRRVVLAVQPLVAVVLVVSAPALVPMIFGGVFRGAVPLVVILVVGELLLGLGLIESRILLGLGRVAVVGGAGGMLALLATALYPVGALLGGGRGAAIATVVVYAVFGGFLWSARKRVALAPDRKPSSNVDDRQGLPTGIA